MKMVKRLGFTLSVPAPQDPGAQARLDPRTRKDTVARPRCGEPGTKKHLRGPTEGAGPAPAQRRTVGTYLTSHPSFLLSPLSVLSSSAGAAPHTGSRHPRILLLPRPSGVKTTPLLPARQNHFPGRRGDLRCKLRTGEHPAEVSLLTSAGQGQRSPAQQPGPRRPLT